jgi:hypothetical protein
MHDEETFCFARGECEVHLVRTPTGYVCRLCILDDGPEGDGPEGWPLVSAKDCLGHLTEHQKAGHTVPLMAFLRLRERMKEEEGTP